MKDHVVVVTAAQKLALELTAKGIDLTGYGTSLFDTDLVIRILVTHEADLKDVPDTYDGHLVDAECLGV